MAGAGYKLFATGDVLTAAQVNTYLMQQTVMVFASSAARTSALSGVIAEGMVSYLQDTNSLEVYDGSAWIGATGDITALTAGTGINITNPTGPIPTVAIDTAVTADLTTAQTLTNKTLTTPVISTITNTGTLTLPTSTDTLVGRATTDTLTNKTLTSPVISTITNTGTLTLPTSTDTLVGRATTDTLTNKTLTSPVLTTPSISNIDAKGDLLAGTADNTIGRLAVGANDTVLTADSSTATGLKWATAAGGGGITLLSTTTLNSGTTSQTISGISSSYKQLLIVLKNLRMSTGGASWTARLNSDTGSNYLSGYVGQYWAGAASSVGLATSIFLASRNSGSTSWNKQGYATFSLIDYNAAGQCQVSYEAINHDGGAGTDTLWYTNGKVVYNASTAVSSITFIADTNFTSGTVQIYGVN